MAAQMKYRHGAFDTRGYQSRGESAWWTYFRMTFGVPVRLSVSYRRYRGGATVAWYPIHISFKGW